MEPLLELRGIVKHFPGVTALDSVDLKVAQGEIHALVGQNGAGKSALIKVLSGAYTADAGEMRLSGAPYRPRTPLDALEAGVRVVYQEFNQLPYLSVAENLLFERLPRRFGVMLDRNTLSRRANDLLRRVGLEVDPAIRLEHLGIAQRQLVEIAKALSSTGRLLVLDEPTATLTPREAARLFDIVRSARGSGVTVIYVSHHLQEIFELCDRVTVLRNGRRIESFAVAETSAPQLVRLMVGRPLEAATDAIEADAAAETGSPSSAQQEPALRLRGLRVRGSPHPVSFDLKYGEILGLAGLVGSGRTELLRAIFGADRREGGEIYQDGHRVAFADPVDAVRHRVCLLTENRKEEGLVLAMPVRVNITLTDLAQVSRAGLLRVQTEVATARHWVRELDVRSRSIEQTARELSGGNQQKLIVAKWLFRDASIIMLDEPTRGIDVGAKAEIYTLLRRLAKGGKALLVVSSELPELMVICDRILVLSRGRLAGELHRHEFDEERILSLAYSEYLAGKAQPENRSS
ncbi:MAG: sugar ABC transporter ATP-binding protein [Verrucomicrobia bacterium]|nr:sugar ABC transporter ATP-binding protein [Verrucomicrobiota bacterium]